MPRQATNDGNLLQLSAINHSRTLERPVSLRSFYATDGNDSDASINSQLSRAHSIVGDYPIDNHGKYHVPNAPDAGKGFRKKVKKIVQKEKSDVNDSVNSDDVVETARGATAPSKRGGNKNLSMLVESALDTNNRSIRGVSLQSVQKQLKGGRVKLFAARTAIEVQPKLLDKLRLVRNKKSKQKEESPGVYSLHASQLIEQNRTPNGASIVHHVSDSEMKSLLVKCRTDSALNQDLLYNPKYDNKWKTRYTDWFVSENGEKKVDNRQGWVFPLKKVCSQAGIPSRFFTDNRTITLAEARAQVLYMRLNTTHNTSVWLTEGDASIFASIFCNPSLLKYMNHEFDPRALQMRLDLYVNNVRNDLDKVLTGKYYNNIKLGKRMFGPSKKQMFESSMIGGMERRFEIIDNQVNHMPFTHEASDLHRDKRRNINVHCRDSTRVVLSYPPDCTDDFIHANRVSGGPLFNEFIITQAPMENTIGDFWRMVWQEKVPYIFMLMSRKDETRCASYWPRHLGSSAIECHGLKIENAGVNTTRDPLFQITSIRITGPDGEEHRLEHWQGNMNNSGNVAAPLNLLRIARNCSRPVVVHDHLGISRAACLVATEIAICCMIKGPTYKHLVQQSVQFLRSQRAFAVETPMQFIFIHRCLQHMFRSLGGTVRGMDRDYQKWLSERAKRMFVDDLNAPIPGYRLLSPKIDPDLLRQVRRPARPNYRREAPDCVGEWPLPLEECDARRRLIVL